MRRAVHLPILVVLGLSEAANAQPAAKKLDLLIRGGRVIDPKNRIDGVMDVGIARGKIALVAAHIAPETAATVVAASGLLVVPGLVDIHTHVFHGMNDGKKLANTTRALLPDGFTFRSGLTTVVDAGTAGWRSFPAFKAQVIDHARTRVLAFLNIVGTGMTGEQDEGNLAEMDPKATAARIAEYRNLIVGVKTAHFHGPPCDAVDRALEAGRVANVPVMVDYRGYPPRCSLEEVFARHMRPGDIYTHMYRPQVPFFDADGKLLGYLREARKRGVVFDVGHGLGGFHFRQAVPATKQGFWPDSISTDIYADNVNAGVKDMTNLMSKFLALGMSIEDVVLRSTWNPAREIRRPDLGSLTVGAAADVAVLGLRRGDFGFYDSGQGRMAGTQKLECEVTVLGGQVVWDLNGRSKVDWQKLPPPPPDNK